MMPARYPIGVVIPTYNRPDVLRLCLERLEQQTWKDFEVLVVDDGSADATGAVLKEYDAGSPLTLRCVRQENSGPARARNLAASLLHSEVCLLIGDDILASPHFVEEHLAFHRQNPSLKAAALGLTRWCEQGQTVTPFMRWLDTDGVQFAYGALLNGAPPTWRHFYTSNLSLKTDLLRGNRFDESFHAYGMEDMELGYRLDRQHMLGLKFLPNAVAEHIHPTTVEQACRRMLAVGAAAHRLHQIWPELEPPPPSTGPRARLRSFLGDATLILPALRRAAALATRFRCPNPFLLKVLLLHFATGYRKAASGV